MRFKEFFAPTSVAKKDENVQVLERAKKIIQQLELQSGRLSHKDISAWRLAHQMALNVDNPNRVELYNIYDFTTSLDTHLSGVVERTKQGVMQRRFKMVDKGGTENEDLTGLFEMPWFINFLSLALDAEYYGHSLIEFGNVISHEGVMAFDNVKLVPRRHVCPEYGVLLREQGDDPSMGIPYRKGGYERWTIEVGKADDLGLFLKVTPHVISKKHVQIFWDNFAERFGIPIIYATTETRNTTDRVKIENMLSQMGNNAWAYFPEGTSINLLETSKGDAFEVFDRRILRANDEISIGLSGQNMAFSDGSSRSQAEVHERGFEEIKEAMAVRLKFLINYRLLPFMKMHGFPVAGYWFEWDDSYEYTPDEMRQIEQMLLQYYDIDPEYFVDRYNVKITGTKSGFFG